MNRPSALSTAIALLALSVALLTGCSRPAEAPARSVAADTPASAAIDQASLCEVDDYRIASTCRPGQKIVFLPPSFGNEQLPVIFAALNCDLRYSVVLTKGAVSCIFAPITPRPAAAASQPASQALR